MNPCIWVRRTTDWADESRFRAQLDPGFRPVVDLWNATFNMPLHVFRNEVRQIAARNQASVEGATVASWDDISDGALVFPVDDDDWFAPDAARVVQQELGEGWVGAVWTASWVEAPLDFGHAVRILRRRIFPRTAPVYACSSNNYAMRKGRVDRVLLEKHRVATDWFLTEGRGALKRIHRRLSIHNRTLASITTLTWRRNLDRQALLRKYRQHRRLYDRPPGGELAWADPYMRQMAALMEQLRPRAAR